MVWAFTSEKRGESFTLQKYHEPGPGGGNGLHEKG